MTAKPEEAGKWEAILKETLPKYLRRERKRMRRKRVMGAALLEKLKREGRLPADPEPDAIVTTDGETHESKT